MFQISFKIWLRGGGGGDLFILNPCIKSYQPFLWSVIFFSTKVSPEWSMNPGFGTQTMCPFPPNRGVLSIEVTDTKIMWALFQDQILCPLNGCVPWIEVSQMRGSTVFPIIKVLVKCYQPTSTLIVLSITKNKPQTINNYWTRLNKILWFFCGEQINYLPKPKAEANVWDTGKSQYFVITKFNNCFIIRSPSLFFDEDLREVKRSDFFHTRTYHAWFHSRMSRILFAAKHNWMTLRMSRPLLIL